VEVREKIFVQRRGGKILKERSNREATRFSRLFTVLRLGGLGGEKCRFTYGRDAMDVYWTDVWGDIPKRQIEILGDREGAGEFEESSEGGWRRMLGEKGGTDLMEGWREETVSEQGSGCPSDVGQTRAGRDRLVEWNRRTERVDVLQQARVGERKHRRTDPHRLIASTSTEHAQ